MVKPEKFDNLHLVYHFTLLLTELRSTGDERDCN